MNTEHNTMTEANQKPVYGEEIGMTINPFAYGKCSFDVRETLRQLQQDRAVFMSWGSHAFKVVRDKHGSPNLLRFAVSGYHHKGHVYITLDWSDTYIVTFTTRQGKIKEIKSLVYCDMLVQVIDRYVEYKEGMRKPVTPYGS